MACTQPPFSLKESGEGTSVISLCTAGLSAQKKIFYSEQEKILNRD